MAAIGSGGPSYKVGPAYQINGVWYYPKVDYDYQETGIASWYGEAFDQKPTANGEIFDLNQLTAAHKTLPLPSVVEVTNQRTAARCGCVSTTAARLSATGSLTCRVVQRSSSGSRVRGPRRYGSAS
jgi:hypothetical protein